MALSTTISQKISLRRRPIMRVNWRRVYALPTRHGLMVGLAVFGVFAISVRIQHNMLLLMAVALFVIFLISVIWAALNLHGIKGEVRAQKTLIAASPAQVEFYLFGRHDCYDLRLKSPSWHKKRKAEVTSLYAAHIMNFTPANRGREFAPPFLIETHFPFGLVRVWQWLFLPPFYVAPEPDFQAAQLLMTGRQLMADTESDDKGEFNADSLENWQEGVPLSRISWKQYAAKDRLLYKTGAASGHDVVRLHFHDIALDDFEAVLRVLCGGVILAHEAGLSFELALDDGIAQRFSHDEIDEALRRLAICGKDVT
ncbi:MAG: hypothetical protein ACON49_09190 [Candidatus Puniceispirillaceae bacterium]